MSLLFYHHNEDMLLLLRAASGKFTAGDSGDEGPGVRLTAKTFGVGQRDMASGKLDKLSPSGLDAASSEGV